MLPKAGLASPVEQVVGSKHANQALGLIRASRVAGSRCVDRCSQCQWIDVDRRRAREEESGVSRSIVLMSGKKTTKVIEGTFKCVSQMQSHTLRSSPGKGDATPNPETKDFDFEYQKVVES